MNKIYVVGIGPGAWDEMTIRAARVLEESDVIIGYTVYADLVRDHLPGREFLTTPMRQEEERCELAFRKAAEGKTTSVICSGDAGVYGMAGLVLQLSEKYPDTLIEIVPGVTAALSGAALLGAPLIHDFCVISLSDLLTPWEKIESRLLHAAQADLSIVLYNPSSRRRSDYLSRACDLLLRYKSPGTVCGIVSRIGREGESTRICTLAELKDAQADMFTTVFVGNCETKRAGNRMVTPRGYRAER